jgi:hypothetical protein
VDYSDARALVKIYLEIPDGSSWEVADQLNLLNRAYFRVVNELDNLGYAYTTTSETITLSDELEYSYSNSIRRPIILYDENEYVYGFTSVATGPTRDNNLCWCDQPNTKIKFFSKPAWQGAFTFIAAPAVTELSADHPAIDQIPEQYHEMVVLKACLILAKSDVNIPRVQAWKEDYQEMVQQLINSVPESPRHVRQVDHEAY